VRPKIGALDTETDGLHIKNSKPFVIQFGFLDVPNKRGFTFVIDLENTYKSFSEEVLNYWDTVAHSLDCYMGHNIKFDLHMLANIGHEYRGDNLTDTMFYIRYGHDALHPEEGGPPLGLKEYATRYIDRNAKLHESKLNKDKTNITKVYNNRPFPP
jgi:DNA polymerase I-like protein with 3'-5' exonuclease and polymerase domains